MAEIVLAVLVIALVVDRFWRDRTYAQATTDREQVWADERQSLLNRLDAKSTAEFVAMERIRVPKPARDPDEPHANGLAPGEHLVGG